MFQRVCGYMGVDPTSIEFLPFEDENVKRGLPDGAAGLYQQAGEKHRIAIETSHLDDPLTVVGAMAHELAHVLLLGSGRVDAGVEDGEPLTDLLTVFLGMGVFSANSVKRTNYHGYYGSSYRTQGYLSESMFAYALALFARDRNDEQAAWAEHLQWDVLDEFHRARRYLAAPPEPDTPPVPTPAVPMDEVPSGDELEEWDESQEAPRPVMPAHELQRLLAGGAREFRCANLHGRDLQGFKLEGCMLAGADLCGANLSDANLTSANLREIDAQGGVFSGAKLRNADLRDADFSGADLSGADLTGADIRGADFRAATLFRTILNDTRRNDATDFADTDLSTAVTDLDPQRENLRGVMPMSKIGDWVTRFVELCGYLAVLMICMILGAAAGGFIDLAIWTITGTSQMPGFFTVGCALLAGGLFLRYAVRLWKRDRQSQS